MARQRNNTDQPNAITDLLNGISPSSTKEEKRRAIERIAQVSDEIERADLITLLRERSKMEKGLIKSIINEVRNKPQENRLTVTDGERDRAIQLLSSPNAFELCLDAMAIHYQGRRDLLALIKLATVTRHFGSAVCLLITGPSGTGKSEATRIVMFTVNPADLLFFSGFSPKFLAYYSGELSHKVVCVLEMEGLHEELTLLRTALTEHQIRIGSVDTGSSIHAIERIKDTTGMCFISTTVRRSIEDQLSTRLEIYDIHHDRALTKRVHEEMGRKTIMSNPELELSNLRIWAIADTVLEFVPVDIPFGPRLAACFPITEPRTMRDHQKLRTLIAASALFHQYQRPRNSTGAVIAQEQDFDIVYGLKTVFESSTISVRPKVMEILRILKTAPDATREFLSVVLGVSDKQAKRYVDEGIQAGYLKRNKLLNGEYEEGPGEHYSVISLPDIGHLPEKNKIFSLSPASMSDMSDTATSVVRVSDSSDIPTNNDKCLMMSDVSDNRTFDQFIEDRAFNNMLLTISLRSGDIPACMWALAAKRNDDRMRADA
jgi:hypothetical protein